MNRSRFLKPGIILILAFLFRQGYAQYDSLALADIAEHRLKQNEELLDAGKSPLLPNDRKKFKGIDFFPPDLRYRVEGNFVRNADPVMFKMKTTTSRLPDYLKFGEIHFSLEGKQYKLEVYQSPEVTQRPGYEDYLFIPFTDLTNGESTYDGGRYLDFRIAEEGPVVLDFNKAYNPYCSYNPKYSCPIPPAANHLDVAIPVGEKRWK